MNYLVTQSNEGDASPHVVAGGDSVPEAVTNALALGFTEGTIWNQVNGATADLAGWVEANEGALGAYRLSLEESRDADIAIEYPMGYIPDYEGIKFECRACAFWSANSYSVAIINEQTGECPVCGTEADSMNFIRIGGAR